jgi:hypothetical protein
MASLKTNEERRMSNYTPELESAIRALPRPVSFDAATKFAEANGLKARSVIAKIKNMGIDYTPKPVKVTKRGEPVVAKGEFISAIEAALGVALPSLTKMVKGDLETLARIVQR